jgi:hypothetical protein
MEEVRRVCRVRRARCDRRRLDGDGTRGVEDGFGGQAWGINRAGLCRLCGVIHDDVALLSPGTGFGARMT